ILFKVATLTYKTLELKLPLYLSELLVPKHSSGSLRSNNKHELVVPRVDSAAGRRSSSLFAPTLWNSLPENLQKCENLVSFRSQLKNITVYSLKHFSFGVTQNFDLCMPMDFPLGRHCNGRTLPPAVLQASLMLLFCGETDVKLEWYGKSNM